MLVLARKAGETILIGADVRITLVRICGGNVRIGIEAPRDRLIRREELQPLTLVSAADPAPQPRRPVSA